MEYLKGILRSFNEGKILHKTILLFLITTGVFIRLYHYLQNPALWLDEATLSLNIINRDYTDLLKPLDTLQVAPIGFLFIEKFLINIFGSSEYILRLLPLLSGVISIPLFYLLAKKYTDKSIAIIALIFFILGRSLIYYSLEVKQYSLDVFVFIFCFLYFLPKEKYKQSFSKSLLYGLIGAIIIWISHISVLVLTAIGLWIIYLIIKDRSWNNIPTFLVMVGIWFISFAVNYYFFLGGHSHQGLQETAFGSFSFFPPKPNNSADISWYIDFFAGLFKYPLEIKLSLLAIILSLLGVIIIIKNKHYIILALFIPLIINFILAIFLIYPCKERLILYNASATIILLAYSIYHITRFFPYKKLLIILLLLIFLINPIKLAIGGFPKEEIRKPMQFIGEKFNENDLIYVQYGSRWSFEYYRFKYIPEDAEIIKGQWIRTSPEVFDITFNEFLERNRVWLLFSHYTDPEKAIIINKCEQHGILLEKYEIQRAAAYLYSFN
ncbi:MAG TPA: glycosyltransferase family 39 protein [Bacteroidales bacterium]|nr:glycosyltransferase family 39 protein [Bacteroidales bacterium]